MSGVPEGTRTPDLRFRNPNKAMPNREITGRHTRKNPFPLLALALFVLYCPRHAG
jgi:hypothetical protein